MGGMARRASAIRAYQSRNANTPLLIVETGNAMKQTDNLDDPASRWAVKALDLLGSHAVNTTAGDMKRLQRMGELGLVPEPLSTQYLASSLDASRGPFPIKPYAVLEISAEGGSSVRVGLLGLSRTGLATGEGQAFSSEQALRRYLPEVVPQSDIVVVLAHLNDRELWRLSEEFPEIDVMVNGSASGEGREFPNTRDQAIVEAAHGGIALGILEVEYNETGTVIHYDNELIPLPPFIPDDPELKRLAEKAHADSMRFLEEVARASPEVTAASLFAGANSCKDCHEAEYEVWSTSAHRHAIESLKKTSDHFNPECLRCHVTGYGEGDRGFVNFVRTPELADVQCEACHGFSLKHSQRPQVFFTGPNPNTQRPVRERFCLRCHTQENSPNFDHEVYWAKIAH